MHDAPFQFAGAHACTINITCSADWYKTICHFRFNVHTVPFKFTCATSLWDVAPTRIFSPSGPGATKLLATRRNMRLKPSEILLWRVWGILSLCHGWKCWMGVLLFCEFLAGRISCSSIQSWWSLPFLQMSQVLASETFCNSACFSHDSRRLQIFLFRMSQSWCLKCSLGHILKLPPPNSLWVKWWVIHFIISFSFRTGHYQITDVARRSLMLFQQEFSEDSTAITPQQLGSCLFMPQQHVWTFPQQRYAMEGRFWGRI